MTFEGGTTRTASSDTEPAQGATESARPRQQPDAQTLINELIAVAKSITPEIRAAAKNELAEGDEFLGQEEFGAILRAQFGNGKPVDPAQILRETDLQLAKNIAEYQGLQLFEVKEENKATADKLLAQSKEFRAEFYRQALLHRLWHQQGEYEKVRVRIAKNLGREGIQALIGKLSDLPLRRRHKGLADDPEQGSLDPTISSSPENSLLKAALLALSHEEARRLAESNPEKLQCQTREFVLGALNLQQEIKVYDVTDVFGAEAGLPASASANDATLIRVDAHWRQIGKRYGVKVNNFNQGTSINCPEQCGAAVLATVNQARRANTLEKIDPIFFVVNNASRTQDADGLEGAEASKSSSLLYFTFDLGDGVIHSGVAYGHQTLSLLKPYIKELYEIENTDKGSQFRSLEHEKHIGALSALSGGAAPAAYPLKPLEAEKTIPSLQLAPNEAMYLGSDKYLNGVTSRPAEEFLSQFLAEGESSTEVQVTILGRQGNTIIPPQKYTLARSLGAVRDGGYAIWESSTPSTQNPKHGLLSIGVFKKERQDFNFALLQVPEGAIIRVEKIPEVDESAIESQTIGPGVDLERLEMLPIAALALGEAILTSRAAVVGQTAWRILAKKKSKNDGPTNPLEIPELIRQYFIDLKLPEGSTEAEHVAEIANKIVEAHPRTSIAEYQAELRETDDIVYILILAKVIAIKTAKEDQK